MKQREWDNLFAGIDKDGDGKISFHEFQAHMLDMLKKEPNFRYEHSSGTASTAFTAGSGPGTTMMSSGLNSQLTGFKSGGTNFSGSTQKPKARFDKRRKGQCRIKAKPPNVRG